MKTVNIKPKEKVDVNFGFETENLLKQDSEYIQNIDFKIYAHSEKNPLSAARIILWNDEGIRLNGSTNNLGSFIAEVEEGIWNYEVKSSSYENMNGTMEINRGEQYVEKIVMKKKGSGTITLNFEQGLNSSIIVPFVSLRLWNDNGEEIMMIANQNGTETKRIEAGLWYYEILNEGVEMATELNFFEVYPGKYEIHRIGLILPSELKVHFNVYSKNLSGERIQGAKILLTSSQGGISEYTTNSSGSVSPYLNLGTWSYRIIAPEHQEKRGTFELNGVNPLIKHIVVY